MKVVFPYLAQAHQLLHSLPIAAAMAEAHRDMDVHIAAVDDGLLDLARRLLARHAPLAPVSFDRLKLGPGDRERMSIGLGRTHFKIYTLLNNRRYFSGFDAVVTPERTSLFLRRLGIPARLIWTRHGTGDREIGFAKDVRDFDFVLLAGRKIEQRLLSTGLIRPGCYAMGIYAKFDWARTACAEPLFNNGRPTVLYNPHFRAPLSSWPRLGRQVLDAFAASTRYNLVFAPHIRLFDSQNARNRRELSSYCDLEHMKIDLGSERSVNMSYTSGADIYLGDVSSQVVEFACRPRPCLFLDAHARSWENDANYRFWNLGPVLRSTRQLETEIDQARVRHVEFAEVQRAYVEESFGLSSGPCAGRGADAIVEFLSRPSRRPITTHRSLLGPTRLTGGL